MNNLLLYCGLVDARISASEKDLPVCTAKSYRFAMRQKKTWAEVAIVAAASASETISLLAQDLTIV